MTATLAVCAICLLSIGGVILRPWRMPEALWAIAGAAVLVSCGLMPIATAWHAVGKGSDVYLFLAGMMLLSETARREGVFDWIAAAAVNRARGSSARLFALVFATGVIVTVFLSNDATAVVMTPAVYAAARKGRADPLPLLFACALVANAASFVLPISNPANLVLYGGQMPSLGTWLAAFALPSLAAIGVTFAMLGRAMRARLAAPCDRDVPRAWLTSGGRIAMAGIALTAVLLLAVSTRGASLGLPTCLAGMLAASAVCLIARRSPVRLVRAISWSVLPLVAGLFVLVEALDRVGAVALVAQALAHAAAADAGIASLAAGAILGVASNLLNNLPAGLIAATAIQQAHSPTIVVDGLLIGVDLGPNLSITGSLATILWLQAIRREGQDVSFRDFLKVGLVTMPPALLAALLMRVSMP